MEQYINLNGNIGRNRFIENTGYGYFLKDAKLTMNQWYSLRARLGKVRDVVLARDYNLSKERIRQLRKRLGIPKYTSYTATATIYRKRDECKYTWYDKNKSEYQSPESSLQFELRRHIKGHGFKGSDCFIKNPHVNCALIYDEDDPICLECGENDEDKNKKCRGIK